MEIIALLTDNELPHVEKNALSACIASAIRSSAWVRMPLDSRRSSRPLSVKTSDEKTPFPITSRTVGQRHGPVCDRVAHRPRRHGNENRRGHRAWGPWNGRWFRLPPLIWSFETLSLMAESRENRNRNLLHQGRLPRLRRKRPFRNVDSGYLQSDCVTERIMDQHQLNELLYQAFETENGGVKVYETALRCVENAISKKSFRSTTIRPLGTLRSFRAYSKRLGWICLRRRPAARWFGRLAMPWSKRWRWP